MYIVRRQFRGLILEHDFCNQSQALCVAIVAEQTNAWENISVFDTQLNETIYEGGKGKQNAETKQHS